MSSSTKQALDLARAQLKQADATYAEQPTPHNQRTVLNTQRTYFALYSRHVREIYPTRPTYANLLRAKRLKLRTYSNRALGVYPDYPTYLQASNRATQYFMRAQYAHQEYVKQTATRYGNRSTPTQTHVRVRHPITNRYVTVTPEQAQQWSTNKP